MKINPRVATMREVATKIVQILSARDIKVTQRGSQAYVKYDDRTMEVKAVNIPFLPDDASDELIDATHGFIDHELGHVFHTNAKELVRARTLGVASLHNTIEDTYVERKSREQFKGAGSNLEFMGKFFLENFTDKKIKSDPKRIIGYLLVPAIRAWAGQLVFQEYMDKDNKWKHIEDITKRLGPVVNEIKLVDSSKDAVDLAKKMTDILKGAVPPPKHEKKAPPPREEKDEKFEEPTDEEDDASTPPEEPGEEAGEKGEGEAKPSTGEKGAGDPSEGEPSEGEPGEKGEGEPSEGEPGEGEAGEASAGEEDSTFVEEDEKFNGSGAEDDEEELGESGAMGEAEFSDEEDADDDGSSAKGDSSKAKTKDVGGKAKEADLTEAIGEIADYDDSISEVIASSVKAANSKSDYVIWSKDFDVIKEFDITPFESRELDKRVEKMQMGADAMVGVMQKDLERAIAARSNSRWQPGLRKGRLNASSLSRLFNNDDRVFRRRDIALSKNVAISLVVDNSGSMSGDKIETASEAAFALSTVLDRMKVAHEIIGFTTGSKSFPPAEFQKAEAELGHSFARNSPLLMPVYKTFEERLGPEVKRRLGGMAIADFLRENVDGESIQIAASRLRGRKEERHVMIVLSDGQPACGSGGRDQLRTHLKNSIAEVAKSGIDIIGIGIRSKAVEEYYPKFVVLEKVEELTGEVIQKIKQLLLV